MHTNLPTNIIGTRVSSSRFEFNARIKCFTAEISELPNFTFGPLYNDACDIGFVMVSSKTGSLAEFYLRPQVRRDQDNDIVAWEFKPTDRAIRANPGLHGAKVVIYND